MLKIVILLLMTFSISFAFPNKVCNVLYEVQEGCYKKAKKMEISNEKECLKVVQIFDRLVLENAGEVKINKEKLLFTNIYCQFGCLSYVDNKGMISKEIFNNKICK